LQIDLDRLEERAVENAINIITVDSKIVIFKTVPVKNPLNYNLWDQNIRKLAAKILKIILRSDLSGADQVN
jgi:hypothetical protein